MLLGFSGWMGIMMKIKAMVGLEERSILRAESFFQVEVITIWIICRVEKFSNFSGEGPKS